MPGYPLIYITLNLMSPLASKKRDLVIHYDEERKVIVFHSVPTEATADVRSASFDGVQPEVGYFQLLPPDEAEMKLGRLVFSLVDLNSEKKIGIRDYESESEAEYLVYVRDLESQASAGDREAQHHLFLALHSSAMKNYSFEELARAENLLLASVAQGYEEAQRSLESWPMLKAAAERRINRGKPV